jgi:hypothetical protein
LALSPVFRQGTLEGIVYIRKEERQFMVKELNALKITEFQ